ncbi:uncharacterized protein [Bemisia tabaci]|uniref:uncharacterized protein isoform X1 n=1 Tax=Bemisia tabaci TaxID=7038 RepID=UPI003B2816D2
MIMREVFNPAEKKVCSAQQRSSRELSALLGEIDGSESRDGLRERKSRSSKSADTSQVPTKRGRDERDQSLELDSGNRKLRKRSKHRGSSPSSAKRKKSKHKHRRHDQDRPKVEASSVSPRVNPIFLWVRQDNTKILEVVCEDYDKRNRIRLTKTPNGWRAIPRTELLVSAISRSNSVSQTPASNDARLVNTQPLSNCKSADAESIETKDNSQGAIHTENPFNASDRRILDGQTDQDAAPCKDTTSSIDEPIEDDSRTPRADAEELVARPLESDSEEKLPPKDEGQVDVQSSLNSVCDKVVDSVDRLSDESEVVDTETAVNSVVSHVGASAPELKYFSDHETCDGNETKNDAEEAVTEKSSTVVIEAEQKSDQVHLLERESETIESHAEISSSEDFCKDQNSEHPNNQDQLEERISEENHSTIISDKLNQDSIDVSSEEVDSSGLKDSPVKSEKSVVSIEESENSIQFSSSDSESTELSTLPVKIKREDAVDICNNFIFSGQDEDLSKVKSLMKDVPDLSSQSTKKEDLGVLNDDSAQDLSHTTEKSSDSCTKVVRNLSPTVKSDILSIDKLLPTKCEVNQRTDEEVTKSGMDVEMKDPGSKKTDLCTKTQASIIQNNPVEMKTDSALESILDLTDPDSDIPLHQKLRLPEGTTISHISSEAKKRPANELTVSPRPAHTNSQPNFLETLLSYPKSCHQGSSLSITKTTEEPLNLGKTSKTPVNSSKVPNPTDSRRLSVDSKNFKDKHARMNDITLKALLNQNKTSAPEKKAKKYDLKEEELSNVDTATRSKLLELLTSKQTMSETNHPLAQLKDIMSNPDLIVPDPLLVPRARLPALIANPAREIPQLLSRKQEKLYPKPVPDPDLLVVSLAHLQSMLQKSGAEAESWLKYQQQARLLQSQMQKDQFASGLDPASVSALNQMLWLPYLNQLEAAGANYGNNQELINMLGMMTPSPHNHNYYQMNPFMVTPPSTPPMSSMDFQQQIEFQKSLGMWQEAIMKSSSNQFIHDFHNNNISKPLTPMESNMNALAAQHYRHLLESTHPGSMTSARTNPISPNYQKGKLRFPNSELHLSPHPHPHAHPQPHHNSLPHIPTSATSTSCSYQRQTSTPSTSLNAPARLSTGRHRHHNPIHKTDVPKSSDRYSSGGADWHKPSLPREDHHIPLPCKSPKIKRIENHPDTKHPNILPNLNIEIPCVEKLPQNTAFMSPPLTREAPVDLSEIKKLPTVPKLKVKQHLVDPNAKPKLLKIEDQPEIGSTTHNEEDPHLQLWHPFFGSQENYRSPWQWTTPVSVSSE